MLAFLLRRLGQSLLVVVVMATLVFVGVYALGNPIDILISPDADQIEREQAIARLGLDQPLWMQFWLFLDNRARAAISATPSCTACRRSTSSSAACRRRSSSPFVALVLSIAIGIPLGTARRPRAAIVRSAARIMTGSIFGFSLPNFWLGLMLILLSRSS